ncbi:MAG TPA: type II toxin-antitoxin system VapC family toxin [Rhabdochlamydiaceae bacterium]|nr:type II toxin-antitoxin system VapC family toxin [Rhabdochlamydiaceae bacterium]
MTYLLDTCILSKLRKIKTHPNKQLEAWFGKHPESVYFISVLNIGEIQKGIAKLDSHENKYKMILQNWLIGELMPRFEGRILTIDMQTASIWGELCGHAQRKGTLYPVIDSLLAASAIQHHLILVTENTKDFIHMGVHLFNPLD